MAKLETTHFTASWSSTPGLRAHLLLGAARARAPPLALALLLVQWALRSRGAAALSPSSALASGALLAVVLGAQRLVGWFAGLLIMPGSTETARRVRALAESPLLRARAPGLAAGAAAAARELARAGARLDEHRAALLAAGADACGSAERLALAPPDGRGAVDGVLLGGERLRRLAAAAAATAAAGLLPPRPDAAEGADAGAAAGAAVADARRAARLAAEEAAAGGCRGVIVYAGGNGEHYEHRLDLVAQWGGAHGFALLLFNYRGVGASGAGAGAGAGAGGGAGERERERERAPAGGSPAASAAGAAASAASAATPAARAPRPRAVGCSRDGGVADVATALAFVTAGLRVPARRVIVFGHSIGGAFAAEAAAAAFPSVCVVSDRSFSTLSAAAQHVVAAPLVTGASSASPLAALGRAAFGAVMRHVACWELDAGAAWAALPRGGKLLVFSADDRTIPSPAQLLTGLVPGPPLANGLGAVLELEPRGRARAGSAHDAQWTPREAARVEGVIREFLAGRPLPASA